MKTRLVTYLVLSLIILVVLTTAASRTFYVEETDFVKITPEGIDLDNDKITYSYSAPLDQQGEWQTGYDDAGEYQVSVTASDGMAETVEKVNIIVTNKNQAPIIVESNIVVKEKQTIDLKIIVEDPDGDALEFSFPQPFDSSGKWKTDFSDEGDYFVEFTVKDGQFTTVGRVNIRVLATNEPPVILDIFSSASEFNVVEDSTLKFFVSAKDNDDDPLVYLWKFDDKVVSSDKTGSVYFDFSSSGKYLLELVIDDGAAQVTRSWDIIVRNKNRRPSLEFDEIIVNEGQRVKLNLSLFDVDGDSLSYTFEAPLDNGSWQTGFEDAGIYSLRVTANDGDLQDSTKVRIVVKDVDRAPLLALPDRLVVSESELVTWKVSATDPDGDDVKITITGAPEGALFSNNLFQFRPDFDFIKRDGGFISNILNSLRLEKYLLNKRVDTLTVKACGRELCTSGEVDLVTFNVNRGPTYSGQSVFYVNETGELKLQLDAVDPDGDIVKYFYPDPLTRRGGTWKTTFEDEGNHTFYVSVSDGSIEKTFPINVIVSKTNREPTLSISNDKVLVNEGEEFTLFVDALDPDGDDLDVTLDFLPFGAEFKDGIFVWTPNFDNIINKSDSVKNNFVSDSDYLNRRFNSEKKVYWLTFSADDGVTVVKHPVKITVKNRNRAPTLIDVVPLSVVAKINEPVVFQVLAGDLDSDTLKYKWSFGFGETAIGGTNTIERTFVTAGVKKVQVSISDGRDTIVKEWDVRVVNSVFVTDQPMNFGSIKVYVIDV